MKPGAVHSIDRVSSSVVALTPGTVGCSAAPLRKRCDGFVKVRIATSTRRVRTSSNG